MSQAQMRLLTAVVAAGSIVVPVGVADTSSPSLPDSTPSTVQSSVPEGLGPNGEVPLDGVTDEDVARFASGLDISLEDARFLLFDGGGALHDFTAANQENPEYGGVRWTYEGGLRIQLRTTRPSNLGDELEAIVGRSVEVLTAGRSAAQNRSDMDAVTLAAIAAGAPRIEATTEFELGIVVLRVHPDDVAVIEGAGIPATVEVREDPTVEVREAAITHAGAAISGGCGVSVAVDNASGTNALMTAAHCPDSGQSSGGFSLGTATNEVCNTYDRQLHTTADPTLSSGFYNYSGQWTNIWAVAGGWVEDEPFFRRGNMTIAQGTIDGDDTTFIIGGGDCASGWVIHGFNLNNISGNGAVQGDSDGPMMFAYFGHWYFAGPLSGVAAGTSDGGVAWRNIPPGWTACTLQHAC